ncbi:MAG: hypothetical protein IT423_00690 [Pirellulaceae bacterium]|nr:hypothetical protein [Pirellulaceae bacterium]
MNRRSWIDGGYIKLAIVLALVLTSSAIACQVPVFRYALERWSPDQYKLMILSDKALPDSMLDTIQQSIRAKYTADSSEQHKSKVNLEVINVERTTNAQAKQLWRAYGGSSPIAVAMYPDKSSLRGEVAHASPVTEAGIKAIVASPAREEIARRLALGHSAVWVLLECGDKVKDEIARNTLEKQLVLDKEWLKLPTAEEMEVKPEVLDKLKVKLRMEFSVMSLSRLDEREQFLVDCLLNSEPDLREQTEPLAFPVFGRGIVLYALVGKGIAPTTIRTASSFLCGPCSCQVKEQNPGFDLLLDHDWESALGDTLVSQAIPGTGAAPQLVPIPPGKKKQ